MNSGFFAYENCLLKHHVRTDGWLPLCRNRKRQINAGRTPTNQRRLKYFTFCAVGAIDVLMLDVAKVVTQSQAKAFDTVFFFDRDSQLVAETQKRIPGAIGFVGNFIETVLATDPDDLQEDPLAPAGQERDTEATRAFQRSRAERAEFIKHFPFDIINLDLEEFLFKPRDILPGKVVNALRKLFGWQCRTLHLPKRNPEPIDGFSLMFTTQIGPPNLTDQYLGMLRDGLTSNLREDAALGPILVQRAKTDDITRLEKSDFDMFFKLAMPKIIAKILMEEDWYIDPDAGIKIYEFVRQSKVGPYKILHLVTDVRRKSPPKESRAPGTDCAAATAAYKQVVQSLFSTPEIVVTEGSIDKSALQDNLDKIKARRKKYCQEE